MFLQDRTGEVMGNRDKSARAQIGQGHHRIGDVDDHRYEGFFSQGTEVGIDGDESSDVIVVGSEAVRGLAVPFKNVIARHPQLVIDERCQHGVICLRISRVTRESAFNLKRSPAVSFTTICVRREQPRC